MKKKRLLGFVILLVLLPILIVAQNSETAINAVHANDGLVSQLAQLLPMGINPYATVFLTSLLSKLEIHNEFVATNPFFDSWIILFLFGLLFLFTALVGTVFKTNKATAVLGLADNYLSNHAAILINVIVILAPSFVGVSDQNEIYQQASILSISLKTVIALIVSVCFLVIVTTVRFFIDILIFLTPIPFIDAVLEVVKIVLTVFFIGISIFYPTLSVILSSVLFLIALAMYKKSLRLVSRTTYLFIYPILNIFKSKERLLSHNDTFSIKVYTKEKTQKFKKGTIVRLEKQKSSFYLKKNNFLIATKQEEFDFTNCTISQGYLSSKITTKKGDVLLLLNRSYKKYLNKIMEELGIEVEGKEEILSLNTERGFVSKVKNMFDKKDIEELRILD